MARYLTAEEVKAEHIKLMGEELGELFHELYNECSWIHIKWEQYIELYGTKPERIDLCNEAARLFFRIVQDTFWDDTLLHLARLTDPTNSGPGKKNLTLNALPELVEERVRATVQESVDRAVNATSFARDRRNRRIAHRDLQLALGTAIKPLESASRRKVKEALKAIAAALNEVYGGYTDSDIGFAHTFTGATGALSLLYVIRDGLEAERARRTRLTEGKPDEDDWKPRPEL